MKDGKHGYFPVAPGAVLFKTFGAGDAAVVKAKLSRTAHSGAPTRTLSAFLVMSLAVPALWPRSACGTLDVCGPVPPPLVGY